MSADKSIDITCINVKQAAVLSVCMSVCVSVCKVMSRGVFSFFASHTAATISTIRSFSSTFQMPFVLGNTAFNHSTRQPLQKHQHQQQQQQQRGADLSYELYITPHYARALVDVIAHYNWKDFWYLYKNDEGDYRFVSICLSIANVSCVWKVKG